ncbi:unnamed protein product, partial [Merluccius merluccius]
HGHGPEAGGVRRVPQSHPGPLPAPGRRRPVARGVRAVRGVRELPEQHLLSAGPQTLLQTGLSRV